MVKRLVSFGFLIWLIPFLLSFLIFPLYTSDKSFFETIMTLTLVGVTAFSLVKNKTLIDQKYQALFTGCIWMGISLLLDFFVFIIGPLKMNVTSYLTDIGLTYLLIPLLSYAFYLSSVSFQKE